MNPYQTYSDLLLTCVNGDKAEIANIFVQAFNKPDKWTTYDEDGIPISQYFVKEVEGPLILPYQDKAERSSKKLRRIVFWEPCLHPGTTACVGSGSDGLTFPASRFSARTPYTWVDVRSYKGDSYPACMLEYFSDSGKVRRAVAAAIAEDGWQFIESGPIQPFENPAYYSRKAIKDRLSLPIVTEYLANIGYQIDADAFWKPNGAVVLLWQERRDVNLAKHGAS
jgi:hypothetical protein